MSGVHEVMEAALVGIRPKNTLKDLMGALDTLQKSLDESEEITDEMVRTHFEAVEAVDKKTDALISVMERLKMEAAQYSSKADAYKQRAQSLENNLERVKDYAKWLLKAHPDLEFRGNKGKLALQRTAPKIVYSTPKFHYSSKNVVPNDALVNVPNQFRKCTVVWTYDNEAIKAAIEAGDPCVIAHLDKNNTYVRIKI